jgi:hypothetical protein
MPILCRQEERGDPTQVGSLSRNTLFKECLHAKDIPLRGGLS